MKRCAWLPLLMASILAALPPAHAESQTGKSLSSALAIKGFGTVGIARSDTDKSEYVRDLSQPDGLGRHWSGKIDSILGLQANLRLNPKTEAVVQGIARYRYDGSWRPELSWAFLRHDFSPDFTMRLGRMGTEFYMQADSRMIGYANLTVRPPADYFGPIVVSWFDGIDASKTVDTGSGLLRGKVFAGWAAEKAPFVEPYTWDLRGSRMLGGHLDYINGPWQVRIGRSHIRFKHQQPIREFTGFDILAKAPELSVVGRTASYDSLGIAYDEGRLQVQGQISRIRYDTAAYEDTNAGYLTFAYRIGQTTPYIGYSRTHSSAAKLTTPMAPLEAEVVRKFIAETHADQATITLGTRWNVMPNMALKAQLDMVRGERDSRFPQRNSDADWNGRLNVLSLTMDFVF
jgi:hypothetical protein